jgi:hypothetical protein
LEHLKLITSRPWDYRSVIQTKSKRACLFWPKVEELWLRKEQALSNCGNLVVK